MPGKGFASMSPERRRLVAAMGGRACPAEKRAFRMDRKLAKTAGKIGGKRLKQKENET